MVQLPGPQRIGRYEIVTHLATGGMGQVFLARASGIGGFVRHVVLKTLDLPGTDEDEAVVMFLDEARLLGLLHHQHITPVYEVGKDDDGQLFIVMDYIHGHTSHDVWYRTNELGAVLPVDFSLTVAAAAAAGLHYAHTRRDAEGRSLHIVHRDVSLSNLMVGFDGAVKLIDFGIAKAANRQTQTQAGFIKGKLGYMAPEQLRGLEVDARTDVFALGIVLYELSTMRRAFREESDHVTMERIRTGKFERPSAIIPEYPAELERIVTRALRVDPRERYPDAEAMRRELDLLGHQLGLVLGDAAIVEVMSQLFEHSHEPWQRAHTTRPSTELEVPRGFKPAAVRHDDSGRRTEPQITLRAATQATAAQLGTPPHGLAKRPSFFSVENSGKRPRPTDTDNVTILSPARQAEAVVSDDTDAMPAMAAAMAVAAAGQPGAVAAVEPGPRAAKAARPPPPPPAKAAKPAKPRAGRQELPGGSRRRTLLIGGIAGITLVAGGAAVALYLVERTDNTPSAAAPPSSGSTSRAAGALAPAPPPTSPPSPTAPTSRPKAPALSPPPLALPAGAQLKIAIKTTPPDATVLLDGKRLGHTPYTGTVDAARGMHTLKLRRNGYATVTLEIPLDSDLTRDITLQRAKGDSTP